MWRTWRTSTWWKASKSRLTQRCWTTSCVTTRSRRTSSVSCSSGCQRSEPSACRPKNTFTTNTWTATCPATTFSLKCYMPRELRRGLHYPQCSYMDAIRVLLQPKKLKKNAFTELNLHLRLWLCDAGGGWKAKSVCSYCLYSAHFNVQFTIWSADLGQTRSCTDTDHVHTQTAYGSLYSERRAASPLKRTDERQC